VDERMKRLGRRHFLTGVAVAAGTAILAACGGSAAIDTPKPAATTAPATSATTAPAASSTAPAATTATGSATAGSPAASSPASGTATVGKGTFAAQIDTATMKKGGNLTEGWTADIQTFNPILTKDATSGRIIGLLFDKVLNIDPDTLQPTANLATKWDVSPDGKTYTFALKQGVKWHDGRPFTADDVKFSYDLYMNPDTGTPRAGELNQRIASVTVTDPQTVVFVLKDVSAPFLVNNMVYAIVPKHILESVAPKDIKTHPFSSTQPVGTGPFRLKEYTPGDHVTLAANPDYHRGAPNLDTYVLRYTKDSTALYQQLKTGEVDFYYNIDPSFSDDLRKQANLTAVAFDQFLMEVFGYNIDPTNKSANPIFQDVKVRQALFYAVDRKGIVDAIRNGLSTVAAGTEPPLSWAYQPDKITARYDYDPKKAAQMLDDLGWKKGSDGIRVREGKRFSFTMYAVAGQKVNEGYMSVFQENWKDIGVEMKPIYEQLGPFANRVTQSFDFEAFLVGLGVGIDPDQTTYWDTKQHGPGWNVYGYNSPQVDQALSDALHTLDIAKRKQLYADMQNQLLADAPALIIDFPKVLAGVNKRVRNLISNAVSVTDNAHQWYVTDGK